MILHLLAMLSVSALILLFIFYDTIIEYLDGLSDKWYYKKQERKDIKNHRGMYDFFHDN